MKNTRKTAIGLLAVTAAILAVLVIASLPDPAAAVDTTRRGNYILTSGRITDSKALVYVINVPEQKLIAYAFVPDRDEIVPVATMELK